MADEALRGQISYLLSGVKPSVTTFVNRVTSRNYLQLRFLRRWTHVPTEGNMKVLIYLGFALVYLALATARLPSKNGYAIIAGGYLFLAIASSFRW
jgi:hypothetical protein